MFTTLAALLLSLPAFGGTEIGALSTCLADHTNGRERKDLARWIFLAIAVHPEIRDVTSASEQVRDQADRKIAAIFMRLLTENCASELKSVVRSDGSAGLQAAFKALGELAMVELITNGEVSTSLSRYAKYLDQRKIEAVLGGE
jgi:hypothetical protein